MKKTSRCPGGMRHWRIIMGTIGMRSPVCIRCGSPNPRPLTEDEWREVMSWLDDSGRGSGQFVRAAWQARMDATNG